MSRDDALSYYVDYLELLAYEEAEAREIEADNEADRRAFEAHYETDYEAREEMYAHESLYGSFSDLMYAA